MSASSPRGAERHHDPRWRASEQPRDPGDSAALSAATKGAELQEDPPVTRLSRLRPAGRPLGEATGLEPGSHAMPIWPGLVKLSLDEAGMFHCSLRPGRVQCGSMACSVSQRLEALQRFLGRGAPNKCLQAPSLGFKPFRKCPWPRPLAWPRRSCFGPDAPLIGQRGSTAQRPGTLHGEASK